MINNTKSLKHRLLIELLYSSGIRVGECVKIKIEDVNINEKIIFIKKGKGSKDRFVITSNIFIDDLKKFISQRKKQSLHLFNNGYDGHISIRTAEEIVRLAAKKAGISKRVYPHLLRASFATHLLEDKVGIETMKFHSFLMSIMNCVQKPIRFVEFQVSKTIYYKYNTNTCHQFDWWFLTRYRNYWAIQEFQQHKDI